MENLTERVNALCMALQGTGIRIIPMNERKEPLLDETGLKPQFREEILKLKPHKLGIQLSESQYEAVAFHPKNAENPKSFAEILKKELFRPDNLHLNKFIFYTSDSSAFHLIYRTGHRTVINELAKGTSGKSLIQVVSSKGVIEVSDTSIFTDISNLKLLSTQEHIDLLNLCYLVRDLEQDSETALQEICEAQSTENLSVYSGKGYSSSIPGLYTELHNNLSSNKTSTALVSNDKYVQTNTSISNSSRDGISTQVCEGSNKDTNSYTDVNESNNPSQTKKNNRFRVQSLSDVLKRNKDVKPAKMLFGEFWHEGEFCILFGQANTGKSTLTTQIVLGLSRGKSEHEYFTVESKPKKILFFDLEMSERQISRRLKGLQDVGDNILRVDFNPDYLYNEATKESAFASIEALIEEHEPDVIFLDNMSVIQPNNENAADSTYFMSKLNALKQKFDISILVVAHTPKIYQMKLIEITDLAGSAQNGNLADSIFTIGKTTHKNLRYLKQIKVREKEFTYDTDNVLLMEFSQDEGWLHFNPLEQVEEYKQLSLSRSNNKDERDAELYKLYLSGVPVESLESQFGLKRSRVYDIIKTQKNSSPTEGTE